MANRETLSQHYANNSYGSSAAAFIVWRRSDADSCGATGHLRSSTEAGYKAASALPQLKIGLHYALRERQLTYFLNYLSTASRISLAFTSERPLRGEHSNLVAHSSASHNHSQVHPRYPSKFLMGPAFPTYLHQFCVQADAPQDK
jgi:hypothetical protein